MEPSQLEILYPQAERVVSPKDENLFVNIPFNDQWLSLDKQHLSSTEIKLLNQLFSSSEKENIDGTKHPWFNFLFKQQPLEEPSGIYRVVQFQLIKEITDKGRHSWLKAFSSMFENVSDAFFISNTYGVLIEKKSKQSISLEQLEGILLTLESDFSCKVKAFMGSFYNFSEGFPRFFHEEKNIFEQELPHIKSKAAIALPQVALHFFTKDMINNSLIMQVFGRKLAADTEMKEIIISLWNNQGNISSTAKELFMHRNTLQYRIEKFYEQTGLHLKSMDDLVLSYLIVN